MKVEYRSSFVKDIKKLKSRHTANLIQTVIENCEMATRLLKLRIANHFTVEVSSSKLNMDNTDLEFLSIKESLNS
jgi:hypothetical protein